MIYSIFLYQANSGLLIYEQNFQELDSGSTELFSSFFSAVKSFISEVVHGKSNQLKNIDLGEYSVNISSVGELNLDIVIISDKEDTKKVDKLVSKIIKNMYKHESILKFWDGDKSDLSLLDHPISELVDKTFGEKGKSLLERPEQILKSIWAHKAQLSDEDRENLIQERDLLIYKIEKATVLPKKLEMAERVIELSEELKDEGTFLRYQEEKNRFKKEINDAQFKLEYYLEKTKTTLDEAIESLGNKPIPSGDFKDTYLSLYSFSTKLKLFIENGWEKYREMANKLIDKDNITDKEISETVQSIVKMSDLVEDYIKR